MFASIINKSICIFISLLNSYPFNAHVQSFMFHMYTLLILNLAYPCCTEAVLLDILMQMAFRIPFTQVLLNILIMLMHYYNFKASRQHMGNDNCKIIVYVYYRRIRSLVHTYSGGLTFDFRSLKLSKITPLFTNADSANQSRP